MTRLWIGEGRVRREDRWPTDADLGNRVMLPRGEVGTLTAWWHADDGDGFGLGLQGVGDFIGCSGEGAGECLQRCPRWFGNMSAEEEAECCDIHPEQGRIATKAALLVKLARIGIEPLISAEDIRQHTASLMV